jgi:hypothetical protein
MVEQDSSQACLYLAVPLRYQEGIISAPLPGSDCGVELGLLFFVLSQHPSRHPGFLSKTASLSSASISLAALL